MGYAAACSPEGVGWPDKDRISADDLDGLLCLGYAVNAPAERDRFSDPLHGLFEQLPILGHSYGLGLSSQELDAVPVQSPAFGQLRAEVQSGLPSHACQDAVHSFFDDYLLNYVRLQRLHIDAVCHVHVRLDRGGIGVDQNCRIPFLYDRFACLGSGEVEFCRLAYDYRA